MSSTLNFCTMLGIEVSEKMNEIRIDDKFLPYTEGHECVKLSIKETYDANDKAFFGLVLASGDKYEDTFVEKIDLNKMLQLRKEIVQEYEELFNEKILEEDCYIYSFDYYY